MLLLCKEPVSSKGTGDSAFKAVILGNGQQLGQRRGILSQRTGSYLALLLICIYPQNKMFRSAYSPFGQN